MPDTRVQVVELKVPVELVVNVTVPVGTTPPAPEASDTVAVHVDGVSSRTLVGAHATEVADALIVDASVKLPLLPV